MKNLAICFVLLMSSGYAQDPFFVNTNQSLLTLNPSFAGSNGFLRNQLSYRNQYPAYDYANQVTYNNSFDAFIRPVNGAVGVSYAMENQGHGVFKNSVINFVYAQHFDLFNQQLKLVPSIQVGYCQKTVDYMNLYVSSPLPDPTKTFTDVGAGLLAQFKKDLYVGASLFHLNRPDDGLYGSSTLPYRVALHTSYTFHLSDKNLLQLFYRFNDHAKDYFHQVSVNTILFSHLMVGAGYISEANAQMSLGYRGNFFSVQLSYDTPVGQYRYASQNSFEVCTSFNLRNREQRRKLVNFESL